MPLFVLPPPPGRRRQNARAPRLRRAGPRSFIRAAAGPAPVQIAQEQEAARPAGRPSLAAADGRSEFRGMFVSLVDPAGLLDMEKCGEIAGRMERAALESGYGTGARMASVLADIFATMDGIAGGKVDDGAMHYATLAFSYMMEALYEAAESYRGGGEDEPVAKLEYVRDRIAGFVPKADRYKEELGRADPPGSALPPMDVPHRGKIARDVMRKEREEMRAERKARGDDPIFPPKPKSIIELLGDDYDPDITSVDMIAEMRGRGPPEGYELVKIKGHERWKGHGVNRIS